MPSSSTLEVLKRSHADLKQILARMERGEWNRAIRQESRRERAFNRYIIEEIDRE